MLLSQNAKNEGFAWETLTPPLPPHHHPAPILSSQSAFISRYLTVLPGWFHPSRQEHGMAGSRPALLTSERQPEILALLRWLADLPCGRHEPGFRDRFAQNLSETLEKAVAKMTAFPLSNGMPPPHSQKTCSFQEARRFSITLIPLQQLRSLSPNCHRFCGGSRGFFSPLDRLEVLERRFSAVSNLNTTMIIQNKSKIS